MDTKNTIAAISLSAAVIIIWSLFFGPSPEEIKQNKINQEQVKQEQNLRKEIIDVIENPLFPEEEVENYPGIEVVMASTNYLDIAITNDSGTGQMLSTNMCPLLKICGPTSAVKFLNDQFTNINFIASQSFGGDDINLKYANLYSINKTSIIDYYLTLLFYHPEMQIEFFPHDRIDL